MVRQSASSRRMKRSPTNTSACHGTSIGISERRARPANSSRSCHSSATTKSEYRAKVCPASQVWPATQGLRHLEVGSLCCIVALPDVDATRRHQALGHDTLLGQGVHRQLVGGQDKAEEGQRGCDLRLFLAREPKLASDPVRLPLRGIMKVLAQQRRPGRNLVDVVAKSLRSASRPGENARRVWCVLPNPSRRKLFNGWRLPTRGTERILQDAPAPALLQQLNLVQDPCHMAASWYYRPPGHRVPPGGAAVAE